MRPIQPRGVMTLKQPQNQRLKKKCEASSEAKKNVMGGQHQLQTNCTASPEEPVNIGRRVLFTNAAFASEASVWAISPTYVL